tara:strand:+ start:322 stop:666 length:345 start_codon:yes stop_codon:yes gene_type:complete
MSTPTTNIEYKINRRVFNDEGALVFYVTIYQGHIKDVDSFDEDENPVKVKQFVRDTRIAERKICYEQGHAPEDVIERWLNIEVNKIAESLGVTVVTEQQDTDVAETEYKTVEKI